MFSHPSCLRGLSLLVNLWPSVTIFAALCYKLSSFCFESEIVVHTLEEKSNGRQGAAIRTFKSSLFWRQLFVEMI